MCCLAESCLDWALIQPTNHLIEVSTQKIFAISYIFSFTEMFLGIVTAIKWKWRRRSGTSFSTLVTTLPLVPTTVILSRNRARNVFCMYWASRVTIFVLLTLFYELNFVSWWDLMALQGTLRWYAMMMESFVQQKIPRILVLILAPHR